jgi:hypothetical protein
MDGLEDREDYRAFEAVVIADYDARTARTMPTQLSPCV